MLLPRAVRFVSMVAILAIGACSKPAEDVVQEAHGAEAADTGHGGEPVEAVVTMEQAVADARAAAEAPMAAQPVAAQAPTAPQPGVAAPPSPEGRSAADQAAGAPSPTLQTGAPTHAPGH